ncbi:hypothetical protein Y717_10865 [Streptomyces scopuliridis RB72]|uniref:Uncharacterized protein n=1 Tax=Streptomyces scopuliridis RB72 TaxID=1440053 RepID=A0A2T7SP86_9ACTN|nr:hypothetical protein Y717_10865 [Streptomyces scopuliridis RB72]
MIDTVLFVLLVVVAAGLPLAHWAYPPWRRR